MTDKIVRIQTRYMYGEQYHLPFDYDIWKLGPYARDKWAKVWLKKNGYEVRKTVHLGLIYRGSIVVGMYINSFFYSRE